MFEIAKRVEGLPRHTSIHAAGVIMSQGPLTGSVAIQEGHNDVYVTQYPADALEELGLLKMDFLGLRNLTLLEKYYKFIVQKTGKEIDIRNLPLQDEKTFQLLGRGDTTGVFQLESGGMRKCTSRVKSRMNLKILLLLTRYIDRDRWSKFQPLLNQSTEKEKLNIYIRT